MLIEVVCQPFDWEVEEVDGKMTMRVWGIDMNDKTHLWLIKNFSTSCVVQLPTFHAGKSVRWTEKMVRSLRESILSKVRRSTRAKIHPFVSIHFCLRRPLFDLQFPESNNPVNDLKKGVTGSVPTLYMYCTTVGALYDLKSCVAENSFAVDGLSGGVSVNLWEYEIDTVVKLLASFSMKRCEWTRATAMKVTNANSKVSKLENEYVIDYFTLSRVSDEESMGWVANPGVLSFDIECYSNKHNKFPDMWSPECPMYMITCNYKKGKSQTKTRLLLMGDCNDFEVDGMEVKIIRTESEAELGDAFAAVIDELDPDIITGFRIQSFDFEYMSARYSMEAYKWPCLGRLIGVHSSVDSDNKNSAGYGFNKMFKFKCPGRIVVDLYQYVRREFKWPEYNLNYASKILLRDSKLDISAKKMFEYYKRMVDARESGDKELIEQSMIEMAEVSKYCIQDAELVLRIFEKQNLWVNIREMANVFYINPYAVYTSGQQIRCFNQLYVVAYKSGVVLTRRQPEDFKNMGGAVQKPDLGLYDVLLMDFQSLYPSIIDAENICYTTFIPERMRVEALRSMCNIVPIEYVRGKSSKQAKKLDCDSEEESDEEEYTKPKVKREEKEILRKECWFIKKEYVKGILPTLVGNLMTMRREVQKQHKLTPSVVLDRKQNAYKVSANSIFGFLDATMLPYFPLAASVTSWGRMYIGQTISFVEREYDAKVVYGDTDSCMIHLRSEKDRSKYYEILEEMCERVTDLFPEGIVMKLEHCDIILTIKKKKYAYIVLNRDGSMKMDEEGNPVIEVKGVASARRDNCSWSKGIFQYILTGILTGRSYVDTMMYLIDKISTLFEGKIGHKDMLINKSVGSYTKKSKNTPMKVFSERLSREGAKIEPGERIYYLVVKNGEKKVGDRMKTEGEYLDSVDRGCPFDIDYLYYVNKTLTTHVDVIMSIGYFCECEFLVEKVGYKKERYTAKGKLINEKNPTTVTSFEPTKMICSMLENGKSIAELKKKIVMEMATFDKASYRRLRDVIAERDAHLYTKV